MICDAAYLHGDLCITPVFLELHPHPDESSLEAKLRVVWLCGFKAGIHIGHFCIGEHELALLYSERMCLLRICAQQYAQDHQRHPYGSAV